MPLLRRMYPMGSFILTFVALLLLQSTLFVPHSATLSYRDFKALLKADKVVDLNLGERTISGRLTPAGLEGLLPKEKILRVHTRQVTLAPEIDLTRVAASTPDNALACGTSESQDAAVWC